MLRLLFTTIAFFLLISGCGNRTIAHIDESISNGNYSQAAIRLERCVKYPGADQEKCREWLSSIDANGLSVSEGLRIKVLRESSNPWDKLALASYIQAGKVKPIYPNEINILIEDAFFGFGECAKTANADCMAQYAKMILAGHDTLPDQDKLEAKEKAAYWLNLAARYGNEEARKNLISQGKDIPSPDLAMEDLQKTANKIAAGNLVAQRQALALQRQHNFSMYMQTLLPKTLNCTSNSVGTYTYTNCW